MNVKGLYHGGGLFCSILAVDQNSTISPVALQVNPWLEMQVGAKHQWQVTLHPRLNHAFVNGIRVAMAHNKALPTFMGSACRSDDGPE